MLSLSMTGAAAYLIALIYVVCNSPRYFMNQQSSYPLMDFLESLLDLLDAISRNRASFFFTVVMNFVLLYGIFCVNICSVYLAELAKSLEQKRTGGRDTNEVELGGLINIRPTSSTSSPVVADISEERIIVEKKKWGTATTSTPGKITEEGGL